MATNNYSSRKKGPKQDSVEVRIVLGILRGIVALFSFPFKKKGDAKPKKAAGGTIDAQEVARRWGDIQTSIGLGGTTHFGAAIVSADKLLDFVLRQKGYAGETMGERLKGAQEDLSPSLYHKAWQAHKLRNQLVHEVDSEVLSFQAKEAIQDYEAVLREFGALK